jgi:hypothetical protein
MPQVAKDTHLCVEKRRRQVSFREQYPMLSRAFLARTAEERFSDFRSLCETAGFKPPDGAGDAETEAWWARLLEQSQNFHDERWQVFPHYIQAMWEWWTGAEKALSEDEKVFSAIKITLPKLRQCFDRKNALVARQVEKALELEDRIKAFARRVHPRRKPTELEDKIATFYENADLTQTEASKAIGKRLGKDISQSTVSRALKAVNRWRGANPALGLPQIDTKKGAAKVATSVDPDVIELGARTDGLTKRQRPRRKDYDDDSDE